MRAQTDFFKFTDIPYPCVFFLYLCSSVSADICEYSTHMYCMHMYCMYVS